MKRGTRTQWAERVRRWRSSGLTASAFAARERLNARTLVWWSSKLRRDARPAATFIEVALAPVEAGGVEAGVVEVVVRERVRIRVAGAFDAAVLRRVVAAFEAE